MDTPDVGTPEFETMVSEWMHNNIFKSNPNSNSHNALVRTKGGDWIPISEWKSYSDAQKEWEREQQEVLHKNNLKQVGKRPFYLNAPIGKRRR